MCCRLGLGILRQVTAAVTAGTLPVEAGVVHFRRRPGNETAGMTGIALNDSGNMASGFTESIDRNESTVVTR